MEKQVKSTDEEDPNNESDDECSVEMCADDCDFQGCVFLPAPGGHSMGKAMRKVPNGCTVCLSPFESGEMISWSSNDDCNHAFHHECILDWFKASGKRHCRRRRRQEQRDGVLNYANNPLLKITNFPMLCPCCRQEFIVADTDLKPDMSNDSDVPSTELGSSSASSTDANEESTDDLSSEAGSTMEVPQACDDISVPVATERVVGASEAGEEV